MAISTGCDKSTLREAGEGTAWLMDKNGKICSLKNFLYIPDLTTDLVALSQLARHITIKNEENSYKVFLNNSNKPAFTCKTNRRILETYVTLPRSIGLYTANEDWYEQLGHMHEEGMKRLIPSFKQRKSATSALAVSSQNSPFNTSFKKQCNHWKISIWTYLGQYKLLQSAEQNIL
ncbi:hypothetical protein O181_030597 [Austropuccinia psidii MF-1]|uniref:Uncharacterized protein n=1 Tax=Austropuccinia psidii MF-1 TaxID=1389203 RepID=A0A9Q3CW19_9BASI|nr:hypothetical protein [Austropuccinia psidii MF-1]